MRARSAERPIGSRVGIALLLVIVSAASATALAQATRALKDSPFGDFTEQDLAMFEAARLKALRAGGDGEQVVWNNPATGHSGSVTPIKTAQKDGLHCRLLQIVNAADAEQGESKFWFCELPDGSWKVR